RSPSRSPLLPRSVASGSHISRTRRRAARSSSWPRPSSSSSGSPRVYAARSATFKGVSRTARLLLALVAVIACQPSQAPVRSLDPNAPIVIPYKVDGGGEIRFTVRPRYFVGESVTLDLDVTAGSLAIRGPLAGRVLQSDL